MKHDLSYSRLTENGWQSSTNKVLQDNVFYCRVAGNSWYLGFFGILTFAWNED